tara:strand:- start:11775 stop:12341 length:567 start_codon:yes stop_codon:yes gene_type:complete
LLRKNQHKIFDMSVIDKVDVKRVGDNGETSLGVIYFDGIAICACIEDQEQKDGKIYGETRVSNGLYRLSLRAEGGFHNRYAKKYAKNGLDWHKGMLCVHNAEGWRLNCPDGKSFRYILIHIGNTDDNTAGCLLPNYVLDFQKDTGSRSGDAYEHIYPILRDSILASDKVDEFGNRYIDIKYSDVEDGK